VVPGDGTFELHAMSGVPQSLATNLTQDLAAHGVTQTLRNGTGTKLRNAPAPLPVYLVPSSFDADNDTGITARTCADSKLDGIVVRTDQAPNDITITAAHELFHAYSSALGSTGDPWWEEASATWSTGKEGLEDTSFDVDLQFPDYALDTQTPNHYPYAMS